MRRRPWLLLGLLWALARPAFAVDCAPEFALLWKRLDFARTEMHLRQAKIVSGPTKLGGGATESYTVTFDDGTRAVFKPNSLHESVRALSNYKAEVAAYEVSKLFGFNIVPPTVARKIGGRMGSVQYFVEGGAHVAELPKHKTRHYLKLFDFLISDFDRHAGNILAADEQVVAIDHGFAFRSNVGNSMVLPWFEGKEIWLDTDLRKSLAKPSDAEVKALLLKWLPESKIQALLERRKRALEEFEHAAK